MVSPAQLGRFSNQLLTFQSRRIARPALPFHQVDYWFVPKGTIRAALFDMRPSSPTFMATQTVDMGEEMNAVYSFLLAWRMGLQRWRMRRWSMS